MYIIIVKNQLKMKKPKYIICGAIEIGGKNDRKITILESNTKTTILGVVNNYNNIK